MKRLFSLSLILVALLGGCKVAAPREDVFVLDVSQSIDADAEHQMFVVVEEVARRLRRGDSLTIIPITGNADAELQGRTLHYAVPSAQNRQAYDADLRSLNEQMKHDLDRLQADAVVHPGKHTDIIGSIYVAMKEFSKKPTEKRLVILSDFIQDDEQFNFRKDHRLGNEETAIALGRDVMPIDHDNHVVNVVLGRLRSADFSALSPSRQHAINAFWEGFLAPAKVNPDGSAALRRTSQNQ